MAPGTGGVTRDEYARLKDIVAGALALSDADRAAYVVAQCGPDAAARVEVESLLAAAIHAAPLYEDPTFLVQGTRVTFDALDGVDGVALPPEPSPASTPYTGSAGRGLRTDSDDDQFEGTERYGVLRRIGAGGMGVVYEVEDRERRQVAALKTLRRRSGDDMTPRNVYDSSLVPHASVVRDHSSQAN